MVQAFKPTLASVLILLKQGQTVHRSEAMINEAKSGNKVRPQSSLSAAVDPIYF